MAGRGRSRPVTAPSKAFRPVRNRDPWEVPSPPYPPVPSFEVGTSPTLSTPTLGSMGGLASAVGTRRGGGCKNLFCCPPPQLPANRSYKYSPAWPGSLILTLREGGSPEGLPRSLRGLCWGRGRYTTRVDVFLKGPLEWGRVSSVKTSLCKSVSLWDVGGSHGWGQFPTDNTAFRGPFIRGTFNRLPT